MEQELSRLEKISEQRSLDSLTNQLTIADHLVYKKYLTELQNYGMGCTFAADAESTRTN